jgi:hypothetical protein
MSTPATAVIAGANDFPHFVQGWHDRERDGRCGVVYRAAGPRARLRLGHVPGAATLWMLLSGPRGLCAAPLTGRVTIAGRAHEVRLDEDLWVVRGFPLAEPSPQTLEIELELPDAPCPDDVLRNGDGRRLGWFLAAAWQA